MSSQNGIQNQGFVEEENEAKNTKTESGNTVPQFAAVIDVNSNQSQKLTDKLELQLINNGHNLKNEDGIPSEGDPAADDDSDLHRCGFGCFSPPWIQQFGTRRVFIIIFSILGVIQSMCWAYFTGTITSLEKRFKINTKTAGVVMTGNEVSQIIFSIVLSYYGGKGHRPRWIAVGVLFSALACFVLASPHIFYGAGEDALMLTEEYDPMMSMYQNSMYNSSRDFGKTRSKVNKAVELCSVKPGGDTTECHNNEAFLLPLVLIFMSQFVAGIGNIMFFSLGGPYLDDNTKKTNMPMVFGITWSFRLIGPTFGFLLSSACLKLYVNPSLTPTIGQQDVKWIGAWWLGWIILGTLMLMASFFIALFPRELRSRKNRTKDLENSKNLDFVKEESSKPIGNEFMKITEIPRAIKILLKNKVYLFNSLAGVFYIFSAIGFWTFSPKYIETIFMQTASNASIISGTVGIAFQAAGLLGSGWLISKFRPSAKKLSGWNVLVAFLHVAVMTSFTQIGCQVGKLEFGAQDLIAGTWNLSTTCNANCDCRANKLSAVCFEKEDKVYFSACHAGCKSALENGALSNCSCLPTPEDTLKPGTCSEGCFSIFVTFLAITAFIKMLDSTGRIGNMLVHYRCVDKKDRSLSIGLSLCFISIFALLPAPIVFGAIIDSVCIVWNTSKCNGKGNCWLYDGENLRYVFNLTAAAFVTIGGCFDILVWWYVGDLDLYSDGDTPAIETEAEINVVSATITKE